jgi:hypothetical protein
MPSKKLTVLYLLVFGVDTAGLLHKHLHKLSGAGARAGYTIASWLMNSVAGDRLVRGEECVTSMIMHNHI